MSILENLHTVRDAADHLGITPARVRQLCIELNLGEKLGRDRFLNDQELRRLESRNTKTGPKKDSA